MRNKYGVNYTETIAMKAMLWLSGGAAAVTLLMRLVFALVWEQGSWIAIALLAAVLGTLALIACNLHLPQAELSARRATAVSVPMLATGVCLLLSTLRDVLRWVVAGITPAPETSQLGGITQLAMLLAFVFGLLGGLVFIWLSLRLKNGETAPNELLSWGVLMPVLWMWFRLTRYEMSYASALGLAETFYDFGLFILELVFLFKLARRVAGIGEVSARWLLFLSCSTAVFALSGPLFCAGMYLLGMGDAYKTTRLANLSDFAIGVLALVLAISLVKEWSEDAPVEASPLDDQSDEDSDEENEGSLL